MKNKVILATVIIILALGSGIAIANSLQNKKAPQTEIYPIEQTNLNTTTETLDADGGMETEKAAAQEKMEYEKTQSIATENSQDKIPATNNGTYKDYSAETVLTEQKAGNKMVLFFHAPWCPYCKAADIAFRANLDKIPTGVTVLKTDYDSSTELKKKYGVTYQHTFVQIDSDGNMVSKWNGGDIENLKKYLK